MIETIIGAAGLGGLISGAVGDFFNYKTANKNLDLQQENLEWQKDVQGKIFAREDNAVQRRAADLQAAGLSRTLAAGGGANAGSVVSTVAPQKQQVNPRTPENMLQFASMVRALAQTDASIKLTKQQTENAKLQQSQILANVLSKSKDTEIKDYDLKRAQQAGTSYNATGWAKDIKEIVGMYQKQKNKGGELGGFINPFTYKNDDMVKDMKNYWKKKQKNRQHGASGTY